MIETKIILISNGGALTSSSFQILETYFQEGWTYRDKIIQQSSSPNFSMYASVAIVLEREISDSHE